MTRLLEKKNIFFQRERVQNDGEGDKEISQFLGFLVKNAHGKN
jgi:hypothetical protein